MKSVFRRILPAIVAAVLISGCTGDENAPAAFNSIPNPLPEHYPSYGFEAEGKTSIGDRITLEPNTLRGLRAVTATLVSWACENGATWNSLNCVSSNGSTFSHDVTLKIYNESNELIASKTQAFDMPYRPSVDHDCDSDPVFPGGWKGKDGNCVDGLAFKIKFDLSSLNVTLPETLHYELSYNTEHYGPNPIGSPGPYNSLNLGVAYPAVDPIAGSHPDPFGYLIINGTLQDEESSMLVRFDVGFPSQDTQ